MLRKLTLIVTGIVLLFLLPLLAQDKNTPLSDIELAMKAGNYKAADSLLQSKLSGFIAAGNLDTLPHYVVLTGKINAALYGTEKGIAALNAFIELVKSKKPFAGVLVNSYRQATEFLEEVGKTQQAYEASQEALRYAGQLTGRKNTIEVALSEYNLGALAGAMGNPALAQTHYRKALALRETVRDIEPEQLYLSYNSLASSMWYASKFDSATQYYSKALGVLDKMPDIPLNKYYRRGIILNNLAALYNAEGKASLAVSTMQGVIDNFQQYLSLKDETLKREDTEKRLLEAIDNLAGIYKDLGDYGKTGDLLNYSYRQKLQKLSADQPDIFISEILLSQHYIDVGEFDIALDFATKGLEKLEKAKGNYLFWEGDAYFHLGTAYSFKKDPVKAAAYFDKAEALYEDAYQGQYDDIYMDFLRSTSVFYARNNQYEKALANANKVYAYLQQVGEEGSLQGFYQLLNIAEVNYLTSHYQQAISFSEKALQRLNENIRQGTTILDSVKMEVFKPKAILIHAKSEYELKQQRDTVYLQALAQELAQALQILEKRKVLIDDPESINILIADNAELIDFAKKIQLLLFEQTGETSRLDKFINLHESGLYNRIRSRLDKQQAIRFSQLPLAIQEEEQKLKADIASSLRNSKPQDELMNDYLQSMSRWEKHLEEVKTKYPAYYNMRYASIFKPLPELQSSLPAKTSLVRYFFVDSSLYALVVDSAHKKIIPLDEAGLEGKITSLLQAGTTEANQLSLLQDLYNALWAPVAAEIKNTKVIIVPDGILYSLSFDMLTKERAASFRELQTKSLLAHHSISYHYSLFMLGNTYNEPAASANYVAFAPGFSDEIKKQYVAGVKDSVNLDYQYLSLLPQPTSNKLAKEIKALLGGNTYLDDASTQNSFRKNAGNNKIIHIATHAEYNNLNPERSRLIFAKNTGAAIDSNSLFLYDIYNCNVNSELTLLTACESGKPGYKDGEGMISLAHAFNYAGSKRILTGLWKIDEQASSNITGAFVEALKEGMPADEALRKAKLDYLSTAEGRMLAPSYWAGLVLMGNPDSILFKSTTNYLPWILAGAGVLALGGILAYRRRKM